MSNGQHMSTQPTVRSYGNFPPRQWPTRTTTKKSDLQILETRRTGSRNLPSPGRTASVDASILGYGSCDFHVNERATGGRIVPDGTLSPFHDRGATRQIGATRRIDLKFRSILVP